MTAERYQLLKSMFEQALGLNVCERAVFLDSACAQDPELREELERLLASEADETAQILDTPLSELAPDLEAPSETDMLGESVGPYRLERLIGQGGMGTVYEAWRDDGEFRHRVALKLIRRDATSALLVRRFRQERQILAGLSHPHIARLLDGGITGAGQPYFVMEYVEGLPIQEYCETHGLDIRERAALFRQICSAVHYAHQNLIVHRDLKPSNVLVTEGGEVKLLDFGIAKLLSDQKNLAAPATRTEVLLMTPEYASPEQIRGEAATTVSDVYSLGVILYELLTGRYPYPIKGGLLFEIERVICQEDPLKPSTAVVRLSEAVRTSVPLPSKTEGRTTCQVRPEMRARQLRGDLDNIVLKAMAKDPSRRYASAEAMSEDIRRYLVGEPVTAHPPTLMYRSLKFIRRHQAAVGSAFLVLLCLSLGIIATSYQAARAERERQRAERRFQDVRRLAHSLLFDFHNSIEKLPGSTPVRKALVQHALEYLNGLARDAGNDVSLQLELASAYAQIGKLQWARYYAHLGDLDGAWQSQRRALAIREALSARDPNNEQLRLDLSSSYMAVGDLQVARRDLNGALASYHKASRLREELAAANPTAGNRSALAVSYQRIGDTLGNPNFPNLGDTKAALENFERMQKIFEALAAEAPGDRNVSHSVAIGFEKMGDVYGGAGDLARSLEFYRKELAEDLTTIASEPGNVQFTRDLYVPYEKIGMTLVNMGDLTGALRSYREALSICERLAAVDPANVGAQNDLAVVLSLLGNAAAKGHHMIDASRYQLRSLKLQKELADRPGAAANDLNNYAWQLLTCEPRDLRNPALARQYAERAAERSNRSDPNVLDTFALALHLTGDDNRASETEALASSLVPVGSTIRRELEKHLQQYRAAMDISR